MGGSAQRTLEEPGAGVEHAGRRPGSARRWLRTGVFLTAAVVVTGLFIHVVLIGAVRVQSTSMEGTLLPGDCVVVNKFIYGLRTPDRVPFINASLPAFSLPRLQRPATGDVVLFRFAGDSQHHPIPSHTLLVKRIIGCPGDTVTIVHGRVFVNRELLTIRGSILTSALPEQSGDALPEGPLSMRNDYGPVVVPGKGMTFQAGAPTIAAWERLVRNEGHGVVRDGTTWLLDGMPCTEYRCEHDYYFVLGDNLADSYDSRFFGPVRDDALAGKIVVIYWSRGESSAGGFAATWFAGVRWDRLGTIVR